MAKRFLELDVARIRASTVYLVVDDEDERFRGVFDPATGKPGLKAFGLLRESAHQAADQIRDHDWEEVDDKTDIDGIKEIDKKETLFYGAWDACSGEDFRE